MSAYYNEIDPFAAQWLRNLIAAGHIAAGEVDERSIVDVSPDDLRGFTQCRFFAGIAGWSLALRLAGWPDDRPVWTGSCPCQPFSAAGKGKAADDERHLWPRWFPLIAECRAPIVFGEQVEAAIGWGWLDAVFADLEGEGYACGAAVLPACSVGAPHIRQRLWFVADASGARAGWHAGSGAPTQTQGDSERSEAWGDASDTSLACCATGELGDADLAGSQGRIGSGGGADQRIARSSGVDGLVGDAASDGQRQSRLSQESERWTREAGRPSACSDCDWLPCTDGKARPVEPGTFPLAHGIPGRVGRLRACGNAITPQVAAEFIRAAA